MENAFTKRLEKIEKALNSALNMNYDSEWKLATFGNLSDSVKRAHIQNLIEPNKNLIDLGGKRWRPLFLILCYEFAANKNQNHLPEDLAYKLTSLVEFAHTASLIHDDIEDSADFRRGQPAAHIKYGIDTATNCADWLYFQSTVCIDRMELLPETKLSLYQIYSKEMRRLLLGQAMDINWHRQKDFFPTIDAYNSMVKCKTGTLASLACQVGLIAGGDNLETASRFGEVAANIGIGFQIIDDILNLTKGNPGKKRGDDIVEGKKSLPILLHIKKYPEDKKQLSLLMEKAAKEGIESPAIEECIQLLQKSGCIQDAQNLGIQLIKENCNLFGDAPLISQLFESMIPQD